MVISSAVIQAKKCIYFFHSLVSLTPLLGIHCSKVGWHRRARVVQASLGMKANKVSSRSTQEMMTWKRLDDATMSKIDVQSLFNANARRWLLGGNGTGLVSPFMLILLTLIITVTSSFLFNYLYQIYRRHRGSSGYSNVTVEEDIPLEKYPDDDDNSDDD